MNQIANKFLLAGNNLMPEMQFKTTWTYLFSRWTIYLK